MTRLDDASNEWTFDKLKAFDDAIGQIAREEYRLDVYPNQIEVISAEQMLDAYSSVAMPVMYPHWSFGKDFAKNQYRYEKGQQNLAYEIVINSSPCISYLMEENTLTMQALVIAHACYGHNAFFKGNYLFKQWTQADSIVDYLLFAKKYVMECEERYGSAAVEEILDAAHALQSLGVDRYKRKGPEDPAKAEARRQELEEAKRQQYDDLMSRTSLREAIAHERQNDNFPVEPEENLLYFIEKYAPKLKPWERELVRIVRKVAQYFYPQSQTKVMNEGYASFWHYTLCHRLHEKGLVGDGFMLEFLTSHTNVVFQPEPRQGRHYPLNPYALGFAIFADIRRMCEHPTEEDYRWFPELAGQADWVEQVHYAMRNYKDESFIRQYLSPKVIRDFKLFAVADHGDLPVLMVDAIHNEEGYQRIRTLLADQYARENHVPDLQVTSYARLTDRSLTLTHFQRRGRPLDAGMSQRTTAHAERLWGFPVRLETVAS